jgi:hypothetical protein
VEQGHDPDRHRGDTNCHRRAYTARIAIPLARDIVAHSRGPATLLQGQETVPLGCATIAPAAKPMRGGAIPFSRLVKPVARSEVPPDAAELAAVSRLIPSGRTTIPVLG